jgi:arylsulfatase A-like enzyme
MKASGKQEGHMANTKHNRRDFLKIVGLTLTAASFPGHAMLRSLAVAKGGGSTKPNFIVIFTDDQGYNDVGCFGAKRFKTPRLDQMAREGMKLTSFYSQPVCGPARAALLTGCYPVRLNDGGWDIESEEITIAEILQEVGYTTGCVGKWDISGREFKEGRVPNDQGFNSYFGALGANDKGNVTLWRNKELLGKTDDMGSLTGLYTDEAIKFIEKSKDNPFFLYLAHTMPHVKIGASAKFRGQSGGNLYGDVIEEIDWNVGRILDTLKELRLDTNTFVLFTSDNGPWLSKGKMGGSASPLRNGKGSSWEGGYRVPCILWGPGRVPAGIESDELITTLDLMPTFAALADGQAPTDRVIDGHDQSAFIVGKTDKSTGDIFYYYIRDNLHAVRQGKWKLALPNRKEFFRYAKDEVEVSAPELYDLESDIAEKHNIAENHPDIVGQLLELAEQARQDIAGVGRRGKNTRKPLQKRE